MEKLGVLERKDTNKADAKVNTECTEMLHMDAGYLAAYTILIALGKKRENIAGGKFGPSLRPTKLCCYS